MVAYRTATFSGTVPQYHATIVSKEWVKSIPAVSFVDYQPWDSAKNVRSLQLEECNTFSVGTIPSRAFENIGTNHNPPILSRDVVKMSIITPTYGHLVERQALRAVVPLRFEGNFVQGGKKFTSKMH